MKRVSATLLYGIILCWFSGCVVGPNYRTPSMAVRKEWITPQEPCPIPSAVDEPLPEWWLSFPDPLLHRYIREASLHNQDLRTAETNILQARALYCIAKAPWYPQISLDINGSRSRFSDNGPIVDISVVEGGGQPGFPTVQFPLFQNLYNILFDVSWELDFFGKTRRSVESASAQIGVAFASRDDLLVTLYAEVAKTYMEIRGAQKRASLLEQNIRFLEQKVALTKERRVQGLDSDLQTDSLEAELETLRAAYPATQTEIYQGIYALSVLTGQFPEALLNEMLNPEPLPDVPARVATGIRADLVRRRPDIRRAENELHAAVADIGVATAELYPTPTILGYLGLQSLFFDKLFQAQSKTWSIAADFLTPIFQGGRLCGQVAEKRAKAEGLYARYKQTILLALQEADGALAAYADEKETLLSLEESLQKFRKIRDLVAEQYAYGLVGVRNLIDAERDVVRSEQDVLDSHVRSLVDLISLYKALGGGWEIQGCC